MKSSSEMLQNLPYYIQKPKVAFPYFILCYYIFSPNECPVLCRCRHRPGHPYPIEEKIK